MSEQWPASQASAPPALPNVEDLPLNGDGYDSERVQEAFDVFYRHIAKLDATLQTLETAESFSRQAAELRNELRALRRARWDESWSRAYARPAATGARAPLVSPAVPRIAAEVAFLIAVAVFLGVGGFRWTAIAVVMAAAWLIIALVEWLVSGEHGPTFAPPPEPAASLPPAGDPGHGWQDDEGLTIIAELEPSQTR
jgi:hypothetical protein